MSIRVVELAGAEVTFDRRNPAASIPYFAWGSDVLADLRAAVVLASPLRFHGLWRVQADPKEEAGPGFWRFTVRYGLLDAQPGANPTQPSPPPPPPGPTEDTLLDSQFAFQWAGQHSRFTQSKETVDTFAVAGFTPKNFRKAINVQPDKHVEGVDLPGWPDAITVNMTVPDFNLRYYKACRRLVDRTNAAAFMGQPAGELLYLGGSAQPREGGGYTVTHRFAEAEDTLVYPGELADGLPAAGETVVVPAFHDLWVWYTSGIVDGETVQVPTAGYVERLYDTGDFTALGLYGPPPPPPPPPPP